MKIPTTQHSRWERRRTTHLVCRLILEIPSPIATVAPKLLSRVICTCLHPSNCGTRRNVFLILKLDLMVIKKSERKGIAPFSNMTLSAGRFSSKRWFLIGGQTYINHFTYNSLWSEIPPVTWKLFGTFAHDTNTTTTVVTINSKLLRKIPSFPRNSDIHLSLPSVGL